MQANGNYWIRIKLLLQLDLIASGIGEREYFHEQNEYRHLPFRKFKHLSRIKILRA